MQGQKADECHGPFRWCFAGLAQNEEGGRLFWPPGCPGSATPDQPCCAPVRPFILSKPVSAAPRPQCAVLCGADGASRAWPGMSWQALCIRQASAALTLACRGPLTHRSDRSCTASMLRHCPVCCMNDIPGQVAAVVHR